jgi:hypothetical protein
MSLCFLISVHKEITISQRNNRNQLNPAKRLIEMQIQHFMTIAIRELGNPVRGRLSFLTERVEAPFSPCSMRHPVVFIVQRRLTHRQEFRGTMLDLPG